MDYRIPDFNSQEWEMMQDYRDNTSEEPRQNLIELISHVDYDAAQLGVNSGIYWALNRQLTDEMVNFALPLKLRVPVYLDWLAEQNNMPVEEAARIADELCHVGFLEYMPDENGVDMLVMPIFVVGSFEHMLMDNDGKRYEEHPEIAVGFVKHTNWMCRNVGLLPPANHGVHRPVPVDTALKNESRVESWENLQTLIEESARGSYGICQCICRRIRKQYDELADEPELNWCMPLGPYADYLIRVGKAVRVTKEEYMERLHEAEKRGYVHNVSNHDGPSPIEYICNCDYQSCMSLRSAGYTAAANGQKSNFVAVVNEEDCVACGNCVEKCPNNAVRLGRKLPTEKPVEYSVAEFPPEMNVLSWGPEKFHPDYLYERVPMWSETGTAPCKSNCPAHIAVQGYLRMAAQGRYEDALRLIKQENPLPAVCGTICNRRCEQVCTRGDVDEAVSIDEVKKFIAYRELKEENRYIPEKIRDYGKKLAVIGSGPAGLSCAYYLAVEGHEVTVFEKNAEPGGMLRYGLPSFRLEKDVVEAEIAVLKELGVKFSCGVEVGKDVTIPELRKQGYKAFFIGVGLQSGGNLGIPGADSEGVMSGIDFMTMVNSTGKELSGKVVVIGGGNIGADIARTAVRCGAESVDLYCLESYEEMPMGEEDQELCKEDGVVIHAGWGQTKISAESGRCTGIEFRKCIQVKNDEGRFDPKFDDDVTERAECSVVIYCIGQKPEWKELLKGTKVQLNQRGFVVADPFTYQTADPDVFAAGDALTGQKFAIDAIAGGKQAAISMNRYAWDHHNLKIGRTSREYQYIDKDNMNIESYDTTKRQKPPVDLSKKKTMRDERGVFTEEQVQKETARCLKCGAAHVDENLCLGCGVCTTRCKMDAITLKKKYDCVPVPNEEFMNSVGKEVLRRRDALYKGKPVHKAIATMVILNTVRKKQLKKAKPRKW